jgi:hypothetical protein
MSRIKSRSHRKTRNGTETSRDARSAPEAVRIRRYLAFVRAVVGVSTNRGPR